MWKKKITLWFLSDSLLDTKQFRVPRVLLYLAPGLVLLLVLVSFSLLSSFFGDRVNQNELDKLRAENRFLMEKYDKIRWTLAEAESRFDDLVNKEIAIRTIFNLPEVNPSERKLGTGGPGPAGYAVMTEQQQTAVATEAQVDRLIELSKFEVEKFGQIESALGNIKDRLDRTPSIMPTRGWSSRGFGIHFDPFTGYRQMHKGIDIANRTGTPIVAPGKGKVTFSGYDAGGLGNMIVIDHGYGFVTRYGHLSKVIAKVGQQVNRGDLIGLMGTTGYSTGPHLHYEVWRNGKAMNPKDFILDDFGS
jgi:murein DD-endopeptidase MepM/ murein hydrolase activator NlpD